MTASFFNPQSSLGERLFNYPEAQSKKLHRSQAVRDKETLTVKVSNFITNRFQALVLGTAYNAAGIVRHPVQEVTALPFWAARKVIHLLPGCKQVWKKAHDTFFRALGNTVSGVAKGAAHAALLAPSIPLSLLSPSASYSLHKTFGLYKPTIYRKAKIAERELLQELQALESLRQRVVGGEERDSFSFNRLLKEQTEARSPLLNSLQEHTNILDQALEAFNRYALEVQQEIPQAILLHNFLDKFSPKGKALEAALKEKSSLNEVKDLKEQIVALIEEMKLLLNKSQLFEKELNRAVAQESILSNKLLERVGDLEAELKEIEKQIDDKWLARAGKLASGWRKFLAFHNSFVQDQTFVFDQNSTAEEVKKQIEELKGHILFLKEVQSELPLILNIKSKEPMSKEEYIKQGIESAEELLKELGTAYQSKLGYVGKALNLLGY